MTSTLTENPPEAERTPQARTAAAPAVRATALQLDGKRGRVYGPVDLCLEPGSLNLVTGPAGSGKTSLLLTLVGRMRPNPGCDLAVLGRPLPRRAAGVQRRSAAVGIHGLDDLDEEVTVAATIREREAWLAPWYQIVRTPTDAQVSEVCAMVFGDDPAPRAKQLIHELHETENLQLRLALAMLSAPELVVVDDVDALRDLDSRRRVWETLRRLTEHGVTVVAAAATGGDLTRLGWANLPTRIDLPNHR